MITMKKKALAAGVAAALASLAAQAQDAAPAPAAAASAPAAPATEAAPKAKETEIQRVVVTAQKRKETLDEVPLAISVVSAESLANSQIVNVEDLTRNLPNISFTSQGGSGLGTLEMRGISSQAGSATVSVYLDDISLTTRNLYSQGTAEPRFFDIKQVEVLRGPQGTLYGASSLGGTIKYISNAPDLKHFEGSGSVDLSKTDHSNGFNWQSQAVVNVPLVKGSVAMRLGVQVGHEAGYVDQLDYLTLKPLAKGINSSDWKVFKGSLKADLGHGWSVTPAVFAQQYDSDDVDVSYYHVGNDQVTPYAGQGLDRFQTTKQVREPGHDRLTVPSVTLEGDVGVGDFTGVLSGYKRRFNRTQDGTSINSVYIGDVTLPNDTSAAAEAIRNQVRALPSAVDLNNQIDQKSAELRLASKDYDPKTGAHAFGWIGGVYFLNAKTQVYDNEPVFGISQFFTNHGLDINDPNDLADTWSGAFTGDSSYYSARHYNDRQHSVFGELTYHLSPALSGTVGMRWLSASEHFTREGNFYYAGCGSPVDCPVSAVIDSKATASTPSFKANWVIDANTSVYANVSKGFRLGGANRPVPDTPLVEQDLADLGLPGKPPASFNPDSLWSYELGSKQRLMGNQLSLNLAAYYINWKNIQQDITLPNAGFDFETNVGKAHSYGLEAELRARVNDNLDLTTSAGYTQAVFSEDVPALGTSTDGNGNTYLNVQKGDPIQGVPTGNFAIGTDYHWDITSTVSGFFRTNAQWTSSSHGSLFRQDADRNRPAYWNVDVSGGMLMGRVTATVYVKNFLNNHTVIQHPNVQGVDEAYYMRPRTVGVNLSAEF